MCKYMWNGKVLGPGFKNEVDELRGNGESTCNDHNGGLVALMLR